MKVKFPEQENPFPKTMAKAIAACLVALAIGLFLCNALGAFFGTDESVIHTSTYADYMAATRSMFTDPDQLVQMGKLLDALDDDDDVQNAWHTLENEEDLDR